MNGTRRGGVFGKIASVNLLESGGETAVSSYS